MDVPIDQPLLMRVLASSVYLARRASKIIRNVVSSQDYDIVNKGENDPQSRADRDAQRCIIGSLKYKFPSLVIVGEEGVLDVPDSFIVHGSDSEVLHSACPSKYSSTSASEMVVWVDPLDGTNEFVDGLVDHVTVLIGIAVNGKPVAGVIAQPFYRPGQEEVNLTPPDEPLDGSSIRVVWAIDGLGIFGMDTQLPSTPVPFPLDANATPDMHPNIITVTRSSRTLVSSAVKACEATYVLRAGGCGHKILLLLEGRAHAYVSPRVGTNRWDTCAPEAILNTFGGRLTDLYGRNYDYSDIHSPLNTKGILATPVAQWLPVYAKRLLQALKNDF